ncbi:aminotransferase class I/II-fold pyridoxal phosphate-dependent enzyme [Frigoribacterium salinisoli]
MPAPTPSATSAQRATSAATATVDRSGTGPSRILLSPADVGPLEAGAAAEAVTSGWFAPSGPDVAGFEHDLAARVGRRHAVACSSGTAALHLGLVAAGVRPGDLVVTATFTFAATVNAVLLAGAEPLLLDCDPRTGDLDLGLLGDAVRRARGGGARVSAVVPVDVYGRVTAHERLLPLARELDLVVVSDAAESLGSRRGGVDGAAVGRAAAVSFNGNKIVSTSGGGALLTDDDALAHRARHLAAQARRPADHYLHDEPGFNHRLSNVLSAVGRVQLTRLDGFLARRRATRERYREAVDGLDGVELLGGHDDEGDNCWLTTVLVDPGTGTTPSALLRALDRRGIETRRAWAPLHRQPAFRRHRSVVTGAADDLFARGLCLPSGSTLRGDDRERVVDALVEELGRAR